MLKKDINKYNTAQPSGRPMGRTDGETARAAGGTAHAVLTMFGKLLKTVLCICIITGGGRHLELPRCGDERKPCFL